MNTVELLGQLRARDVRISLEDGKLRVNAPKGVLTPELQEQLRARKDDILALLQSAAEPAAGRPDLRAIPRDGALRASFAQERLWYIHQLEPDSAAYNIPAAIRIRGPVDRRAIEAALHALAERHETLRTALETVDGRPMQVVGAANLPVAFHDLSGLPVDERESAAMALLTAEGRRPFDLARAPLARMTLIRLDERDHALLAVIHHTMADQWSLGVLLGELEQLYQAHTSGRRVELPPLPIQYADYADWQRRWLESPAWDRELAYWKRRLEGLTTLELPTDHPRPAVLSMHGRMVSAPLSADLLGLLNQASQRMGTTATSLLLATYVALLHRWTGQSDIAFAMPMANRDDAAVERVAGALINMVVIRVDVSGNPTVAELIQRVRGVLVEAQEHRDAPYDRLIAELHPARSTSHAPLAQVMFNALNAPPVPRIPGGFDATPIVIDRGGSQMDLAFTCDLAQRLLFVEYSTDLFDEATVARILEYYIMTLEAVAAGAGRRLDEIDLLTASDQRLFAEWNATDKPVDLSVGVERLFEEQARRTPEATAVVSAGGALTYAALDARSAQLAAFLRAEGVGPETLVGVCLQRTPDLLVAVLGVLKAGGAYVPLDPAFPAQRLAHMVEDARLGIILTDAVSEDVLPHSEARRIRLDTDWPRIDFHRTVAVPSGAREHHAAYVLYTSGSTGKPKGVAVPRRALTNFIRSMQGEPGLDAHDVLLAVTTLSFDIAGLELYLPLSVGATIVLATREQAVDGHQLRELLESHKATVMQATPATWRLLIEAGWTGSPAFTMLCGGESLPSELAAQLLPRGRELWNMYGPTETTIWSTLDRVTAGSRITVGRPIANTQVHIVDAGLRRVPVGVPGELCIGGDGVAHGYLHRPELTADRFVPDPHASTVGAKLYRTGDRARWLPDGRLEHLGRGDGQVKIRGFRIELGEIEAVLERHEAVRQAVASVFDDGAGDRRLVAYVVSAPGQEPTPSELRRFVRGELPEYMVPSLFVALDALPLTPNGKVDRRALPAPIAQPQAASAARVAPRTPMEQVIAGVWSELLKHQDISVHDNFFDIGGHSLLSMEAIGAIEKRTGVRLNPARFMLETLEQISATCAQMASAAPGHTS